MKIAKKIGFSFFILAVCVLVAGYYYAHKAYDMLREATESEIQGLVYELQSDIDRHLYNRLEQVQLYGQQSFHNLSEYASLLSLEDEDAVYAYMVAKNDESLIRSRTQAMEYYLVETAGNRLAKTIHKEFIQSEYYQSRLGYALYSGFVLTNAYGTVIAQDGSFVRVSYKDTPWWQSANSEGCTISIEHHATDASEHIILVSTTISDAAGATAALLTVSLNITDVTKILKYFYAADEGENHLHRKLGSIDYYLLLDDGHIFYASPNAVILDSNRVKSMFELFFSAPKEILTIRDVGKKSAICSFAYSHGYLDFKGVDWVIALVFSYDKVVAPLVAFKIHILILAVLIAFFAVVFGCGLVYSVSRPLSLLSKALQKVSAGEFDVQVDVHAKDEIGALSASFQQMTKSLIETTVSKEFVSGIHQTMLDALIVCDQKGFVEDVNAAACELVGYSASEIKGAHIADIWCRDREYIEEKFATIATEGKLENVEIEVVSKSGTLKYLLVSCSPIFVSPQQRSALATNEATNISYKIICVAKDISGRKKIMQDLIDARNYAEMLFQSTPGAIFTVDKNKKITSWNKKAEEITGYMADEIVGKECCQFKFDPCEVSCVLFDDAIIKPVLGKECCIRRKDGKILRIRKNVDLLKDKAGMLIGGIESFEDITEKKEAEKKIREQAHFQEIVLSSLTHPFYVVDVATYQILLANKAAKALGKGDITTCYALSHRSASPCKGGEHQCPIEMVKETKQPVLVEHVHYDGAGNQLFVEVHGFPIFGEDGSVSSMIEYSIDITERRKAEEALKAAKETAEKLAQVKSNFLANMSHEIRTPMNAIVGFSSLLKRAGVSEKQISYIDMIMNNSNQLLRLIDDILDFTKVESGTVQLEAITFNLRFLLHDVVDSVFSEVSNVASRVQHSLKIDDAVPLFVMGDPTRLRQIITNLLSNAIKFTRDGDIALLVEVEEDTTDAITVHFAVSDTGKGIAADKLEQIFEPFTQEDISTTRQYGGTGLGLSICTALVSVMGGVISVESEEGRGSCFSFSLNFKKVLLDDGFARKAIPAQMLANVKVYVNALIWEMFSELFLPMGLVDVQSYETQEGLLERLAAIEDAGNQPNLIICFASFFATDAGIDFCKKLKAMRGYEHAKVVAVSISPYVGEAHLCDTCRVDAYLSVPFTADDLTNMFAVLFEVNSQTKKEGVVTKHSAEECKITGIRVLVAEDNESNRELMLAVLEDFGCVVEFAFDGNMAVEKMRSSAYDICLMDLQMPHMSGIDATQCIREELKITIPIFALTAAVLPEDREAALAVGMNGFLMKPVDIQALRKVLERCIS